MKRERKVWYAGSLAVWMVVPVWAALGGEEVVFEFDDPAGYTLSDPDTLEVVDGLVRLTTQVPVGDGRDGPLSVSGTQDLSDTGLAPSWNVVALSEDADGRATATVTNPDSLSGLAVGDEVLLIELQGTADNHDRTGNHEFLHVAALAEPVVTFETALTRTYGEGNNEGLGTVDGSHRVMLLRVPQFTDVTIEDNGILTAPAWNGSKGGVLAFRVSGTLTTEGTGRIDMSGRGYRGGSDGRGDDEYGQCGEGITGLGSKPPDNREVNGADYLTWPDDGSNGGAGGSGVSHGAVEGGGGSYGTEGTPGYAGVTSTYPGDRAYPGHVVGDADLTRLIFGGGGGGAGDADNGNPHADGGAGGGIVYVAAATVSALNVTNQGFLGMMGNFGTDCGYGVGGSGAGGAIHLVAGTADNLNLDATGGPAQTYPGCASYGQNQGGGGGLGRIRIDAQTINDFAVGTTEAEEAANAAAEPDPGALNPGTGAYSRSRPFVTNAQPLEPSILGAWSGFSTIPGASNLGTFGVQLSDDGGATWYYWDGTAWQVATATDGTETCSPEDADAHIADLQGTSLSFRVYLESDGTQPVELDAVIISYDVDPYYLDQDGDGFSPAQGDCDDNDPTFNPGASEDPGQTGFGDGFDNDCDGAVDEGTLRYDDDEDGFSEVDGDCDDNDPDIHPGMPETCGDGLDQDCDGSDLDCGDLDKDGDGVSPNDGDCDDSDPSRAPGLEDIPYDGVDQDCDGRDLTDVDGDGFDGGPSGDDCDDNAADIHPDADEVCNNIDDNCNGTADEGVITTWYLDRDQDGTGDSDQPITSCTQPTPAYVAQGNDCNDFDPDIHPGASETCNSVDDDCDGEVDENLTLYSYCNDADNDGHGDPSTGFSSCLATAPEGASSTCDDCDDTVDTVFPGAPELCDGQDQDCDGEVDEDIATLTYYLDTDGDGHGTSDQTVSTCTDAPEGYVSNFDDCDDNNSDVFPGAQETPYDGLDQDCDGHDLTDVDGDGFDGGTNGDDCDDNDPDIHPGALEICDNGLDDDCDGSDAPCATPFPPTPEPTVTPAPTSTPEPTGAPELTSTPLPPTPTLTPAVTPTPGTPTPADTFEPEEATSPPPVSGDTADGCNCTTTGPTRPRTGVAPWFLLTAFSILVRRRRPTPRPGCNRNAN